MITSLALLFLVGFCLAGISQRLRLPRIIGMLLAGIILGPFVLDFLDPTLLGISAELRQIALIIILIKAGLSLNINDLRKVGRPALLMSFLPACFEILAFVLLGPLFLGITPIEGAIMGAVLGAVSPAVVVPKMVQLIDEHYGTKKKIPQMILAAASLDDVFVIILFSSFIAMAQNGSFAAGDLLNIPISIILGIIFGAGLGWLCAFGFNFCHRHDRPVRNSKKVIIILALSFLLMAAEGWLKDLVAFSGLLAVMAMAMVLAMKLPEAVSNRLKAKYGKIWLAAEVWLFVLVGAAVDIRYMAQAGLAALGMILIGLIFRSIGVLLSLINTPLNTKERLFAVISYLPKATVQAAIGGVPLALGLPCGKIVLSVAVLSIIVTAPLGAIGMELTYQTTLEKE